jgi:hypothetical protein
MRGEASCPTRELRKLGNLDLVWLRDQARENAIRVGGRGAAPSPDATGIAEKVLTLRLERYVDRELARRGLRLTALTALVLASLSCGGGSPEESRRGLYSSTAELKEDSAATVAFFETVLADSVQREQLARVILGNEGMRRTMTEALLADSLARVEGAGLPEWRAPAPPAGSAPGPGGDAAPGAATGPGAGDRTPASPPSP